MENLEVCLVTWSRSTRLELSRMNRIAQQFNFIETDMKDVS